MGHHDFWIHGVSVQIQNPERISSIHRVGSCAVIQQQANTKNWFHFPIPTPTRISSSSVDTHDVYVRAKLNENARITHIHVWDGDQFINGISDFDIRGPNVSYSYDISDVSINYGMLVCVKVEFLSGNPMGEVRFIGVGARFAL